MAEVIDRRTSFNGGEISPWTDSRIDLEKYRSGAREMLNMRPTVYGGAFGRPGTEFMGAAKFPNYRCRLVEFEYSATTTLVLEFGRFYIRFWFTGEFPGRVPDPITPANAYELVTPWDQDEVFEIQFAQTNDVVIITHPDHRPRRLTRLANNNWTIAEFFEEYPALFDPNITTTTLAASAVTGSGITVTASAALFQAGHVGSTWVIKHRREEPQVTLVLTAAVGDSSDPLFVLGEWTCDVEVNSGGTWYSSAVVERSYDKVTWETIRPISSSGLSSGIISGTELDPCFLRVTMNRKAGSPPTYGYFTLAAVDPDHYGIVRIDSVTSSTVVVADVLFELGSTDASERWQEGAWSAFRGYPRSVAFHENRLMFGGSASRPQTVWGSVIDDYSNFRLSADDDSGLSIRPSGLKANSIQWMVSQDTLLIGTAGSEGPIGSRDGEKALGPSTAKKGRFTTIGSAFIQAVPVNDTVIFIQRSGRKLWEFSFAFESDGMKAVDLTLLSEHITDGAINQMTVQKNSENVVWCVTGNGQMIGLTYERAQNVAGWCRYTTGAGDSFESSAWVSSSGEQDEGWVSVRRVIDGETVRYIERFQRDVIRELKDNNQSNLIYSDSAVVYTGAATDTMTGLGHLEGMTVAILADGAPCPPQVVTGGSITIQFPATTIIAGLPFISQLEPTYLETNDPNSLSKVASKLLKSANVELWQSLGMEISGNGGRDWERIEFREPSDNMDQAPPLFTGMFEPQYLESDSTLQRSIIVRQTQPLPLNILSIHTRYLLTQV